MDEDLPLRVGHSDSTRRIFFILWQDEVPQIINRQQKTLPGGVVKGLCSIADIGGMKPGKFFPVVKSRCSLLRLVSSFIRFLSVSVPTGVSIIEFYPIFNENLAKITGISV